MNTNLIKQSISVFEESLAEYQQMKTDAIVLGNLSELSAINNAIVCTETALETLQAELDRQENKALTIEELSLIDDTQVWFVCEDEELCYKVIIDDVTEFRTSFTPHYKGTRNIPSNAKQRWSVLTSQIEKGYFNFYKHKPKGDEQ